MLTNYQYDGATIIIILNIILTAAACEPNSLAALLVLYTAHPHSKDNCQSEKWHVETAGCVI